MYFQDLISGEYRIYTGALEAEVGEGYMAALVIERLGDIRRPGEEVFRDVKLCGGHRWACAQEALSHAIETALDMIDNKPQALIPRLSAHQLFEARQVSRGDNMSTTM